MTTEELETKIKSLEFSQSFFFLLLIQASPNPKGFIETVRTSLELLDNEGGPIPAYAKGHILAIADSAERVLQNQSVLAKSR